MKILSLIFLILLSAGVMLAQEKDTTKFSSPLSNPLDYYLSDDFELNLPAPDFSKFSVDEGNVRLFSLYLLSESMKNDLWNLKSEDYMLSNYHEFYIQNSKFNPLKAILGMAQLGAVGYLAYRHIRKYGLFN